MKRISAYVMGAEVMKATRNRLLTRGELAIETGAAEVAVSNWVDEFVAQGILEKRAREKREGSTGYAPIEFTLAPEWIGPHLATPQGGSDQAAASVGQDTEAKCST